MDTFFYIEAQKRSRVTILGAQTQHRVVLRLVPPSASKQSEIMCARDKCGVFHNIGKAISGSTEYIILNTAQPRWWTSACAVPLFRIPFTSKNTIERNLLEYIPGSVRLCFA